MPTIAEKWLQEGLEKRDIEIVEKMIENNMADSDIRKITGLSLAKIGQLRKKLKKR